MFLISPLLLYCRNKIEKNTNDWIYFGYTKFEIKLKHGGYYEKISTDIMCCIAIQYGCMC